LLREQQDPTSANYHQWLSPEEFADRFGVAAPDFQRVVDWLRSQGLTITETARSRRWIAITGTARDFNNAFQADVHAYAVGGTLHYANASEPTVPADLRDVVLGFHHLHDFKAKSRLRKPQLRPDFNDSTGLHYIAPDDFATIYDVRPLYNAGIDGTGESIAIAGETDILLPDIRAFRLTAKLPANDPQVILVPGTRDPGVQINSGDLEEADLDIEWAGAVARNAKIIYVNSGVDTFDSLQYAIDQNLAPVVSISYGDCEPNWTTAEINNFIQQGQQANAQGMTISTPSGDAGAADCEFGTSTATTGLNVDIPGALPYATSVGGTTLNDIGNVWSSTTQNFGAIYGKPQQPTWNSTNNSAGGSALSYIPEITWNDTPLFSQISSGGGGRSSKFGKPTWQTGPGVPNDNARDVPDISFAASPDINGYIICSDGGCVNGFYYSDNTLTIIGGTSAGTPAFAGVVALINQKMNARQGNVNPTLYKLATTAPAAFHDVTGGGNMVPCQRGTPNCGSNGYLGYAAGPGYDLATGWGSLDVFKLVLAWPTQ
jgi:subtilase family serine protease